MPLPCGVLLLADGERGQGRWQQEQPSQRKRQGIRAGKVTHQPRKLDTGRPADLMDEKWYNVAIGSLYPYMHHT